MSELHPATRAFAGAARYERGRPGYPASAVEHIVSKLGLRPGRTVLDLAAGTGKLTRLLGPSGATVIAVEPVAEMRKALAELVPGVRAFDGTAERILLGDSTVDAVTVAQAFHWFDAVAARREFTRVVRPHGLIAIWWNSRRLTGTHFLEGYEALLRLFGTDYARVAGCYADDAQMHEWFGASFRGSAHLAHCQLLDFAALRGRLMSSSYAPQAGDPGHAPMLRALRQLFDSSAVDGKISFDYDTRIFVGQRV